MASVLVAYASTHGQTAKIASRVGDRIRADGLDAALVDIGGGSDPDPAGHDGAVLAASVHRGAHQPEAVAWARRHATGLAERPSAFLSVSLTAADDGEDARAATKRLIEEFAAETGWTPTRAVSVAGALQYREYDVFTRTLMRLLMRRGGHPTDASRDYDYTDWDALERFASEFGALAAGRQR